MSRYAFPGAGGLRVLEASRARGALGERAVRAAALLLLWIPLLSIASCADAPGEATIDVSLVLDPTPPRVGPSTARIEARDASGAPLAGATIQVEANMNHAGMVPVFATAEEIEPGVYRASFDFTMGGDWFLLLNIEQADGATSEHVIQVPAVRTAGDGS